MKRYAHEGPGPLDEADWEALRSHRRDMEDPYLREYLLAAESEEVEPATQYVYVLTATFHGEDTDDYCAFEDGITSVHASEEGAVAALDRWLLKCGVEDVDLAHFGEVRTDSSLCCDSDPDLLDGMTITWGINRMEVRP